ncbi:Hypothetical predicted protein [Pelobates cultripes]|uniref:Uncharacterized protein n=1 Tax=Pelobates cultripes TaxID=61616 RepID=A0AAD1WP32_PELCU|nr:Hypothetical predicted protein [Pelobates cultripes]
MDLEAEPETEPHTHPHKYKREAAQAPRTSNRPEGWAAKQRRQRGINHPTLTCGAQTTALQPHSNGPLKPPSTSKSRKHIQRVRHRRQNRNLPKASDPSTTTSLTNKRSRGMLLASNGNLRQPASGTPQVEYPHRHEAQNLLQPNQMTRGNLAVTKAPERDCGIPPAGVG